MTHWTHTRGDERIDLCLSHDDQKVVVQTRFELINDVWVNTTGSQHFHRADVASADALLRKMSRDLEDDGYTLADSYNVFWDRDGRQVGTRSLPCRDQALALADRLTDEGFDVYYDFDFDRV